MILAWIGVALLAVSWLLGLSYYHQADLPAWTATVVIGSLLLTGFGGRMPSRGRSAVAAALVLPAVVWSFWAAAPYRAAPLLLVVGLALYAAAAYVAPGLGRFLERACAAALSAGCILLAQSLALLVYQTVTSRSHELPGPLPHVIGMAAGLLGIDVAVHGSTVAMYSMRKVHLLGATWELLLDPATLGFLIGGTVLLGWKHWDETTGRRRLWRGIGAIVLLWALVAAWLPFRAALYMAIYLHDVLRTDYDAPLDAVKLLWSTWIHLALLAPPVLAAWRLFPRKRAETAGSAVLSESPESSAGPSSRPKLVAAALVLVGVGLVAAGIMWDPVGRRKPGRVVVEEYHPEPDKIWEPTGKPFDTEWYGHLSGYNYYCIYDYLSRYYRMSRRTEPLDDRSLGDVDVLIVKVPTRPYAPEEVRAVRRFVQRGGGLLLVGEHTNVFHSGEYVNSFAREFGFTFRYDCLFGVDSVFEDRYIPPQVPHPVVQHMGPLDFATSCSIDPGTSRGRAVIRGTGLKNKMADYHAENFYPQTDDDAAMRYGAFVQLWSMRSGRGRVLAFSDSTIFSNFSTFEPGKAELMLGMVEWLNHQSPAFDPRWPLAALGVVFLIGGLAVCVVRDRSCMILIAAGLLGWTIAGIGVKAAHRRAMPALRPVRPMTRIVSDRTVCSVPLPKNGFIAGNEDQFGIFERWILRLGYFTARAEGDKVFEDDPKLVVFFHPDRPVTERFRKHLVDYVAGGGNVLVIDSAKNKKSTTGALVKPFGLSIDRSAGASGTLKTSKDWPSVPSLAASTITGGRPFATVDGKPVGVSVRHKKGRVVVVGFGYRFTDANMGVTGDVEPDDDLRQVFELEYTLLRTIVEGKPLESQ